VSPAAAERPAARGALGALGVMGHHPDPGRRAAVRGRRPRATSLAMAVLVLACSSAFTPPQPGVPGMARRPGAKPRLRPGSSWTAPPVSGIALLLRTTRHGHNEKRVGAASVRMIGGVTTAKDGDSPNRNLGVHAAAHGPLPWPCGLQAGCGRAACPVVRRGHGGAWRPWSWVFDGALRPDAVTSVIL
jgi:hypothetical protein